MQHRVLKLNFFFFFACFEYNLILITLIFLIFFPFRIYHNDSVIFFAQVTVEDAEFFEQLERDQLRRKKFRHLREELELEGFRAEAKNLCTSVSKTEGEDEEEIEEGERKKTSSSGSTVTDTQPVLSVVSSHVSYFVVRQYKTNFLLSY
jgi:hypothetical protein